MKHTIAITAILFLGMVTNVWAEETVYTYAGMERGSTIKQVYKYQYQFRGEGADMGMYIDAGCQYRYVSIGVSETIQKDGPGGFIHNNPSGYLYIDSGDSCSGSYRYGSADIILSAFEISNQLDSAYAKGSGIIYGWAGESWDDTTPEPYIEPVSVEVTWDGIGDLYSGKYKYSETYNYPGFSVRYTYQGSGNSRDAQATGSILGETSSMGLVSNYAAIMQVTERSKGMEKYSKEGLYRTQNYCEGNFDGDQDVDGNDAFKFKSNFGRSKFNNPCP